MDGGSSTHAKQAEAMEGTDGESRSNNTPQAPAKSIHSRHEMPKDGYSRAHEAVGRRVNRLAPACLVHPLSPRTPTWGVVFSTARADESPDVEEQFGGVLQLEQVCQTRVG